MDEGNPSGRKDRTVDSELLTISSPNAPRRAVYINEETGGDIGCKAAAGEAATALNRAFFFSQTVEGTEFWASVWERLVQISENGRLA